VVDDADGAETVLFGCDGEVDQGETGVEVTGPEGLARIEKEADVDVDMPLLVPPTVLPGSHGWKGQNGLFRCGHGPARGPFGIAAIDERGVM
jgi:hypothetical protein